MQQILQEKLFGKFAQGKTSALDLIDLVGNDKRLRVDLQNQLIKVTQLAVGDDAEHHLLLLLFQTAGGVDEGGAAVNLLVDCLVDALVFGLMTMTCVCFCPIISTLSMTMLVSMTTRMP